MTRAQRNHEVQTLASHGSDDAFSNRIRHWRPYWRFEYAQPPMPYTQINLLGENGIPVMDQNAVRVIGWNRLSQLL